MLPMNIIRRIGRSGGARLSPTMADPVGQIVETVTKTQKGRLRPIRLMTCTGQGSGTTLVQAAATGEGTTADGADYRPLIGYSTQTYGASGGPQQGHLLVVYEISPGNSVILGHI